MTLTRDQILSAADHQQQRAAVPEWGGEVILSSPTLAERDAYITTLIGDNRTISIGHRARLVVRCLVDDHGVRVFSDEDADLLAEKNPVVIDRLFDICQRLTGMVSGTADTLEKNSVSSPIAASVSS